MHGSIWSNYWLRAKEKESLNPPRDWKAFFNPLGKVMAVDNAVSVYRLEITGKPEFEGPA